MRRFRFLCTLVLTAPLAVLACGGNGGSGGTGTNTFGGNGGAGGNASSSSTSGNLFDAGPGTGGFVGTGGVGTGGTASHLIYASTDTDLYTLDPDNFSAGLTHIGTFDCITPGGATHYAMTDIALDKDENLFGVTGHDVVSLTVQGTTIHCGPFMSLTSAQPGQTSVPTFYALTFSPVGTLDPAKEILVGGNSVGELWRIDTDTSTTKIIGNFGTVPADDGRGHTYAAANVGKPWELSGDIVFLANGGSPVGFATVRDCPSPPSTMGCSYVDTLLEIDMTKLNQGGNASLTKAVRGQLIKGSACNDTWTGDYGSMFGIAAWDTLVFGLSRTGNLVTIDNDTGGTCLVQNYSPQKFSGAAVTTLAPVKPPPPIK